MKVKLIHHKEIKGGTDKDGLAIAPRPETFSFELTNPGGDTLIVPNDPTNRHYQKIASWYDEQEKKPFKFAFEKLN